MTTAPRPMPTLESALLAVTRAGFPKPLVLADAYVHVPHGYAVTRHHYSAGAWANWWLGLTELVYVQPRAHYYALFQDDVELCLGVRAYCERQIVGRVASIYTPPMYRGAERWVEVNPGRKLVGALAFVFPGELARQIVGKGAAEALTWRLTGSKNGRSGVDGALGLILRRLGIPLTFHNPSLVRHTGTLSSIHPERAATGRRQAAQFAGVDFDALTLLEK